MGKYSKILGVILLLLGFASIAMYFVMGDKSEFKVIFDSDGGSVVNEQIVKKGEKAVKPDDPTKADNEFVEWQLDGLAYNFDTIVSKDMTLKANWKEIVKYTIKVTLDDKEYTGSVIESEKITLEGLKIPEKEGFEVKFYDAEGEEYDIDEAVKSNMELTAKYVEIKTFTVKFNSDGGSKVEDIKVPDGSTISAPVSTKDGYVLDGWYLGEQKFDFTTPISKDITLKARWTDGEKINVIFSVDGTTYKTISVKENTTVSKPSNPTKKGYKFVEWQLDGLAFDFKTKITKEITLTAVFEESHSVTVSFNTDGGSKVSSQEVETGGKAKAPTNPTRDGYKFVEWQLNAKKFDFNTAVNDNITLKAIWVKVYTVKFDSAGGSNVTSQIVEEGATASKPANPTRSNYLFKEWLDDKNETFNFETPITKDITLTAYYERVVTPTPSPTPSPTPEASEPEQNTGDIRNK